MSTEQFPIPCRRCGAAMAVIEAQTVFEAPTARCEHCGATEPLAADAAERMRALRTRLTQIRWAEQAEEAPALAIAQALTMWKKTALPGFAFMGLLMVGIPMLNVANMLASGASGVEVLQTALMPLGSLLLVSVICGAFILGMRAYAKELVPGLQARPPRVEGAPMRCRACGGSLPSTGLEGMVVCGYCAAHNLVSVDIAKDRHARLELEMRHYAQRLLGHRLRMDEAAKRFNQRMYLAAGIGVALCVGVTMTLSLLGVVLGQFIH